MIGGVYRQAVTHGAKLLNDTGIAASVIDVFGPRGVKSTDKDLIARAPRWAQSPAAVKDIERDSCAGRGATMEGSGKARETAGKAVIAFLGRTLRR